MPDEREFMQKAVEQARLSRSEPGKLSPKVGAVVVKSGAVIASAFRGEDKDHKQHAEFILLEGKLSSETLAASTIYTTLEPCFKRGPQKLPCSTHLIRRKVDRVVVGMLDPDPTVHGKGQMELLKHGIEVGTFSPDLTSQILEMNREFIADRQSPNFTTTTPGEGKPFAPGKIMIRGAYRNAPTPGERFAVLTQRGKTYWPQTRFVIRHNNLWDCELHENNEGETTVLIVKVDPSACLWVDLYASVVQHHRQWVGLDLEQLPPGIEVNASVTINILKP